MYKLKKSTELSFTYCNGTVKNYPLEHDRPSLQLMLDCFEPMCGYDIPSDIPHMLSFNVVLEGKDWNACLAFDLHTIKDIRIIETLTPELVLPTEPVLPTDSGSDAFN